MFHLCMPTVRKDARRGRGKSVMRRRLAFAATSGTVAAAAYYDERIRRQIVIPVVGGTARVFVRGANNLTLHDEHHLHDGLRRPVGTAMLSVSNHISTMDDPGMLAAIVPLGTLLDPDAMRWGVCAEDVCFKPGSWLQRCASTAKVMPVRRGGGVWQAELDAVIAKLRTGDWVHYFPEGVIRQDGQLRLFRRGVGRLVAAVPEPGALIVLPFYHTGADKVQPTTQTATSVFSAPNLGTPIHVIFGAHHPRTQAPSVPPTAAPSRRDATSHARPSVPLAHGRVRAGPPVDLSRLLALREEPPFDARPELLYEAIAHSLEEEVARLKLELEGRLAGRDG